MIGIKLRPFLGDVWKLAGRGYWLLHNLGFQQ